MKTNEILTNRANKWNGFTVLFDLNNAVLNIAISRLKNENPDLSENELIQELKEIFRVDFNEKV
ncbi:MAG: hypothetical protein ACTSPD_17550 [Promethearchaeota archaeon]